MDPIKKELMFQSFDELSKNAVFDFKKINFKQRQICSSLLKMYDQGVSHFKLGDDEVIRLISI
jgi:hypothetical protein